METAPASIDCDVRETEKTEELTAPFANALRARRSRERREMREKTERLTTEDTEKAQRDTKPNRERLCGPPCQAASERKSTLKEGATRPAAAPRASNSRTARRPSSP